MGGGKRGLLSARMEGAGRPVWMVSSEVAEKAGDRITEDLWLWILF